MNLALEPPASLELDDSDTTVLFVWARRDSVRIRPNWHKLEQRTADSVRIEYRARHRYGRLELERRMRDGGRITETYYLSPARNQLFVMIETEGTPLPLHFRRIYDRAP